MVSTIQKVLSPDVDDVTTYRFGRVDGQVEVLHLVVHGLDSEIDGLFENDSRLSFVDEQTEHQPVGNHCVVSHPTIFAALEKERACLYAVPALLTSPSLTSRAKQTKRTCSRLRT